MHKPIHLLKLSRRLKLLISQYNDEKHQIHKAQPKQHIPLRNRIIKQRHINAITNNVPLATSSYSDFAMSSLELTNVVFQIIVYHGNLRVVIDYIQRNWLFHHRVKTFKRLLIESIDGFRNNRTVKAFS